VYLVAAVGIIVGSGLYFSELYIKKRLTCDRICHTSLIISSPKTKRRRYYYEYRSVQEIIS
jgi:hypothetical protein